MQAVKVQIDPFVRQLLQELAADELAQLEQSIAAEGCREALIAWSGTNPPTLLDGHNRKAICDRLKLPYRIETIDLPDERAARNWVIACQLQRRNTIAEQASYLRGLRYNAEKGEHGGDRASGNSCHLKTCERLAAEFGVVERTIRSDGKFAAAVEEIASNTSHAAKALSLHKDKKRLRRNETVKLAKEPPTVQKEAVEMLQSGEFKSYREVQAEFERRLFEAEAKKYARVSLDDVVDKRTWTAQRMEELLPQLSDLDAIITDPPYPEEFIPLYGELARLAKQALKPDGVLAVMCGQSYLDRILPAMAEHLPYRWTLAYLTPGGQAVQLWQRKVNTFWKPVFLFGGTGAWMGDVVKSKVNDNDKRFHGWGQSESGMANLIESLTKPGERVCDPFMGGGTTGVVCVALARLFVGCDIDKDCVSTARKRMKVEKGKASERDRIHD